MSERVLRPRAERLIELYNDTNFSSKEIAAKLTEELGMKVSIASLRQMYETLNMPLKNRPRKGGGASLKIEIQGLDQVNTAPQTDSQAVDEPVRRF